MKKIRKEKKEKHKIYIMLSFSGTWFSYLLRVLTRGKYVHVSIFCDDMLLKSYSFGRKNPKMILPAGFVKEDLKYIDTIYKNVEILIYEMEIPMDQYVSLKKNIANFEYAQEKYRYNILGLLPILFKKPLKRKYHYACSQFVGKVFQDSGIYDFHKDYSLIKPLDFEEIREKKMFYCGNLSDFLKQKEEQQFIES